ncbi:hypothetical protein HQ945_20490 [Phyllobacterium sp. BT25]|uniref:PIN domain-containing protein n=1 Tax=Phyllobacterium pellucidum TaxID=2740464 RepID=A0A849VUJ4_9HYPH|nr:hypothetical protein [Phyllobacterium pellucidum]NTS33642.1 hypothetical protein [Phyllobacterium pellucidum]
MIAVDSDIIVSAFWPRGADIGERRHGLFHLASSANCEAMMSFDADFIKIAKREATLEVRRPV